jgi:hypothetical protein
MIIVEFLGPREDGVNLYRRYSDKGVMLLQKETGDMYGDPVDVEGAPFTYEETDILIDNGGDGEEPTLAPDEISPEEFMALVEEAL